MMASAVGGVCCCRGGGVVASLVYEVRVEDDGSVEYGVSLEAVVVVAPKEQKIKNNAN